MTIPHDDIHPELEAKVGDLCRAITDSAYSHTENILVALRAYEAKGIAYPDMVNALHEEFIVSPNTPGETT